MCGNLFGSSPKVESPKVEKVAPAPTAVQSNETQVINDVKKDNKRQRMMAQNGYEGTRSTILSEAVQGKQRLGD